MVQLIESHCNTTYKALRRCIHAGRTAQQTATPSKPCTHSCSRLVSSEQQRARIHQWTKLHTRAESLVHATAAAVCVHPLSHSNCMAVTATLTEPSARSTPLPLKLQEMNAVPCMLIDSLCDDDNS